MKSPKTASASAPSAPRPRNAPATRQAILDSAREAFARLGYDGAGVREIAAGAGVTAMMVNRYFGSKESLFTEAVSASMAATGVLLPQLVTGKVSGRKVAEMLIDITHADQKPMEGFQIMLRSAASPRAAEIARGLIEEHQQKGIAEAMQGPLAPERAALVLALIAGFQMMRQTIALTALDDASPQDLASLLGPLFQHLLRGR